MHTDRCHSVNDLMKITGQIGASKDKVSYLDRPSDHESLTSTTIRIGGGLDAGT